MPRRPRIPKILQNKVLDPHSTDVALVDFLDNTDSWTRFAAWLVYQDPDRPGADAFWRSDNYPPGTCTDTKHISHRVLGQSNTLRTWVRGRKWKFGNITFSVWCSRLTETANPVSQFEKGGRGVRLVTERRNVLLELLRFGDDICPEWKLREKLQMFMAETL